MTQRLLFICTQNRLRSPTAEQIFASWAGVETDSAGLGNDANIPLSTEQIEWAYIIFVMEAKHHHRLSAKFKPYLKNKRIICLNIPDNYQYMQTELVQVLERKVPPFLQKNGHVNKQR